MADARPRSQNDDTAMKRDLDPQADRFIPLKPVVFGIMMSLAEQERHGYAILHDVRTRSEGRLKLETGPLYRHLKRLLDDRLVEETEGAERGESSDPRRRYYALTELGRSVLATEGQRLAQAVQHAQALGAIPT
ncbi:MAG TPA: PadR family transcriptional regulator [Gemmatimonadetes bacterium]|nr:PadR family transcriptional regulator [Gemmatimonadota bacterium]HBD96800.1 PadR family transcriptional regulator [Gemmatimonadota bacterium]